MFFTKKLFGNSVAPSCEYCRYSTKNESGKTGCRYGTLSLDEPCGRYTYDPLKREPKVLPAMPEFTADDFKL